MSKLKEARESKELSQSELARESGVNIKLIQFYEQGYRDINKAASITVYKLAKALECSVENILEI